MTWKKNFSRIPILHKNLKFLKLNYVYELELAKFMHQIFNQKLPQPFGSMFTRIKKVYTHSIKQINKSNYFLPRVDKIAGQK